MRRLDYYTSPIGITPEGRIKNTGTNAAPIWGWEYDLTDHLGNVRVAFKPNATNNGAVRVEYANYFPFGMLERSGNPDIYREGCNTPTQVLQATNTYTKAKSFRKILT